jgi:hypothetical protein
MYKDIQYIEPDGSVDAATRGWTAEESGFDSRKGKKFFTLP